MKTKADLTRTRGRVRGRRRAPRPPGGKVLQRLFSYLGQRDPALNNDIVATVAVPKAARPNYALTKQALKAKPPTAAAVTRVARRTPAARPYAVSITRAAAKLPRPRRKRAGSRRTARAAVSPMATPPGAPGVWQAIGPTRIKNGQTYGTNRVDVSGRVSSLAVDPNDLTWRYQFDASAKTAVRVNVRFRANALEAVVTAALAGVGIVRAPLWYVADHVKTGRLKIVLEKYERPASVVHALFPASRARLPAVRAFIDLLAARLVLRGGVADGRKSVARR